MASLALGNILHGRRSTGARTPRTGEVVSGGGENGVAVPISALEIVATHPMAVLEVADHGLDGGSASYLAANDFCDAAALAADPDPEPVGIVVAAIALVAVDAADSNTCELFEISDDGTERVAVVRIAMQRLSMQQLTTSSASYARYYRLMFPFSKALDSACLLAVGFHQLLERLTHTDVPVVFLAFPRFTHDAPCSRTRTAERGRTSSLRTVIASLAQRRHSAL